MALSPSSKLTAVLFAAGEALPKKRLITLLDLQAEGLADAVETLRTTLTDSGLALIETEDALELRTSPESADVVQKLRESELSRDLGKASLETLALILYKGTATRGEIDWVRGVNSSTAVRALLMRGLIERIEDPSDKRRAKYRPTVDALAHLGATTLSELPRYAELSQILSAHEATQALATTDV